MIRPPLRLSAAFVTIKALAIGLSLFTLYNIASFAVSTSEAMDRSFSNKAHMEMYSIIDDLIDPEKFAEFKRSEKRIDSVKSFYKALNESDKITFLSAFDQHMVIKNFRGNDRFDAYGSPDSPARGKYKDSETGETLQDVKSMQINENVFRFYHLTSSGQPIDWQKVDYSRNIPAILGSNYRGTYAEGDVLEGYYYPNRAKLTVTGFLSPKDSIFYHGDMNTYLDDYIVIPYPGNLKETTASTKRFDGILAFAMINGDIAAPKGTGTDGVIRIINNLSRPTGFDAYTLLNTPTYLVQFELMRDIIRENLDIVIVLGIFLTVTLITLIAVLSFHVSVRRSRRYAIEWLVGRPLSTLAARHSGLVLAEYAALAIGLMFVTSRLPNGSFLAQGLMLLALACLALLDITFQSAVVRRHLRTSMGEERGAW